MTKELLRGALVAGAAIALLGVTACQKKEETTIETPAVEAAAPADATAMSADAAATAAAPADAMATTAPAADAAAAPAAEPAPAH